MPLGQTFTKRECNMQAQLFQPRLPSTAQTGRLQRTRRTWSVRTQASSSLVMSPGRWLWPLLGTPAAEEPASRRTRDSGAELTAKEWAPYFASLDLSIAMMQANANKKTAKRQQQKAGKAGPYGKEAVAEAAENDEAREEEGTERQEALDVVQQVEPIAQLRAVSQAAPARREERRPPKEEKKGPLREFIEGDLPKKLALLVGLMVFSRVGVFIRLPGVDVDRFAETMAGGGLLGYIDALSGGSISKVGVFSLGIVPYINASIMLQLLATAFPSLKKLQREEGPQGRARFMLYQKLAALGFAVAQAYGQLTYISPFVEDFSPAWLIANVLSLTAGAMVLVHVADTISDLKLGNGTSILIFANIASSLPSSVGAAFTQAERSNSGNLALYALTVFVTTLGIVYVQLADREIPMTYASRYQAGALQRQAYLPFKVNATGVMPVIFASSLLALPSAAARYAHLPALDAAAAALGPNGPAYLPVNVALIVGFNYLYTFLQLEPKELAEQLKRQGASIPAVRPGRATAEFITKTLNRMSVLGSGFLGALAAAPALVEWLTGLQAFRGFAGTSVLILVGVATDTARKFRAELAMQKYRDIDKMYDQL